MFSVSSLANLMQDFRDGWVHAFSQLVTERSPPPPAPRSSQICGGEGGGGQLGGEGEGNKTKYKTVMTAAQLADTSPRSISLTNFNSLTRVTATVSFQTCIYSL